MKENFKRGLFISVEGGDFTGKSSLVVPTLFSVLQRADFHMLKSREPGGTPQGEEIRKQIFQRLKEGASQEELAQLFNQGRRIHLSDLVKPFLQEEKTVAILDRYCDSTVVYQGFEGKVPLERLKYFEQEAVGGYYPDITLLLFFPEDKFASVLTARKRLANNKERRSQTAWDEVDTKSHLQRQKNYFSVPCVYREWGIQRNFAFIDASKSPMEVVTDTLLAVNPFLQKIEGDIRGENERIEDLLSILSSYRAEGHLFAIESQWQNELIQAEGRNNSSKER